jgi:hypothetical protein
VQQQVAELQVAMLKALLVQVRHSRQHLYMQTAKTRSDKDRGKETAVLPIPQVHHMCLCRGRSGAAVCVTCASQHCCCWGLQFSLQDAGAEHSS